MKNSMSFRIVVLALAGFCLTTSGFGDVPEKGAVDDAVSQLTHESPLKVAVCYWGLTRSTRLVAHTHNAKLFGVLQKNNIAYDTFMHTWYMRGKQRDWTTEVDAPIDYDEYKLLDPNYYKIDDQDFFTQNLKFDKYYHGGHPDEWLPGLILNHLCALESLKRVTNMVIDSQNHYDLIIYVRPDVRLDNELPVAMLRNLKDGDILVPDWDNYEGYNDKFAVLTYKTAPLYGKRIDGLAEFRKNDVRITSEKYVKYVCDKNHLNVLLTDFRFAIIKPWNIRLD